MPSLVNCVGLCLLYFLLLEIRNGYCLGFLLEGAGFSMEQSTGQRTALLQAVATPTGTHCLHLPLQDVS
jgi:hypothetical protein